MAATREEISRWFDDGVVDGASHMLIICDTWDFDDFPVYVVGDTAARVAYHEYRQKEHYRVMEVYNLRLPKEVQMAERRAFHLGPEVSR